MNETTTAEAGATPSPLPILRNRFVLREQKNNVWSVTLPASIGRDDLEAPAIIAAAPEGLAVLDLVWLLAYDGSFIAEGIVSESAKVGARIQVLRTIALRELAGAGDHQALRRVR